MLVVGVLVVVEGGLVCRSTQVIVGCCLPTINILSGGIHFLWFFTRNQSLANFCHPCFPLIVFFGVGSIAPLPNPKGLYSIFSPQVFEQSLFLFLKELTRIVLLRLSLGLDSVFRGEEHPQVQPGSSPFFP